jgi:hypothetical protein
MTGIGWRGRLVLVGLPFLWLGLFFLVPLLIVLKISLARSTIGVPPYTPFVSASGAGLSLHASLANFALLTRDDLYLRAYLGSLANAGLAPAVAVSGRAAVLDELPDPGLRVDRDPAAERAAEPGTARGRVDPHAVAVAEQRLFGRARAGLFVPAVHGPADLW